MALRRMNDFWKTMALALIFGLLLLHRCQGQEETTQPIVPDEPAGTPTAEMLPAQEADSTANPTANQEDPSMPQSSTSDQKQVEPSQQSSLPTADSIDPQPSQENMANSNDDPLSTPQPDPLPTTKMIIMDTEAILNQMENQASNQGSRVLHKEPQGKEEPASGSSSAVFASVLVTGLLLAAIIVAIYYFKFHRRTNSKGVKLAEESFVADEENQGNTLVSVAPLNQPEPPEKPQEKVSLNGESQEAVKPQTPPAATNGHSTTKTADTEL